MAEQSKPADAIPRVVEQQEREAARAAERKRHAALTTALLRQRYGIPPDDEA